MDSINLVLFGYLFIIHVQIPLYGLWTTAWLQFTLKREFSYSMLYVIRNYG